MSKWDGGEGGGGEKKEREERRERGVRVNTAHFPFKHANSSCIKLGLLKAKTVAQ